MLLPHASDRGAVVLLPFWHRVDADVRGALAGKIGAHGPHHRFGRLGRRAHLQVNIWRLGVKGSGRHLRVPLVQPLDARRLVTRGERGAA